jgi:hypothetical protein
MMMMMMMMMMMKMKDLQKKSDTTAMSKTQ